jgi:hypothetical protein
VFGLHDEIRRFLRRKAMVIGKRATLRDLDARLDSGGKELFGIADACKRQDATSLQRLDGGWIGDEAPVKDGKAA